MNYKEQLDKKQKDVDLIRDNLKKSMLEDEKKKHEVVENVISILSKEKIPCFLFVDIPNPEYDELNKPCIFQFNNIASIYDYNTEKGIEDICTFNESMWSHLFQMVISSPEGRKNGLDKMDMRDPNTINAHLSFFCDFIYRCLYNYTIKFNKKDDEG